MFNREKIEVKRVPMMPVRDMVIFPQMMTAVHRGARSFRARAGRGAGRREEDFPRHAARRFGGRSRSRKKFITVGTLANIVQSVKLPDGNIRVLVEGVGAREDRAGDQRRGFLPRHRALMPVQEPNRRRSSNRRETRVTGLFEQYVKLSQSLNYDTMIAAAARRRCQ